MDDQSPDHLPHAAADRLTERLVGFVAALRTKGIAVGTSESLDAAAVIDVLGMSDRRVLREGLASAVLRGNDQREVFDMTFDLFFPAAEGASMSTQSTGPMEIGDIRDLLAMALADGELRTLEQLAELAVDFLGGVGTPDTATFGWSAYQTLERLAPQTLIAQAVDLRRANGSGGSSGMPAFDDRLDRGEIRLNVERFRQMVQSEARRRTAEVRGRALVTEHAIRSTSDQLDFLSANRTQLDQLRRQVQPLARLLATRLASRRRRKHRQHIDIRRTVRRSMATGGVPISPVYTAARPSRPDLVLLCDVSGSVAGFSDFTMQLVQALDSQFSKVRVFAFVNAMAEVSDLVSRVGPDLAARIAAEARITAWHSSSDYGEALADFVELYSDAVGPRTCVLILGDARNNNQDPNYAALARITELSRRTMWLNPESALRWGLGDSVAPEYAEIVPMYECCNIDQLARFVSRLLPV